MPIRDKDKELKAFVVPWGQHQWKRGGPFGLYGAPSTFQRMMTVILCDSQYKEALCYLDDILIWGSELGEAHESLASCSRGD